MLRTTHLKIERLSKKLNVRLLKSFKVIKMIDLQVYGLILFVFHKMYFMFHVNLLKSYYSNNFKDRVNSLSLSVNRVIDEKDEE